MLCSAVLLGAGALSGCASARIDRFGTWAEARNAVAALGRPGSRWHATGAWNLSQSLQHLAQSVEGSLAGYPQSKPAWFIATLGKGAHAVFEARGRMTHALDEPIPGAAALEPGLPASAAVLRLLKAMDAFERHDGALAPHFAYGPLTKPEYARTHLMHQAAHWSQFEETRDV